MYKYKCLIILLCGWCACVPTTITLCVTKYTGLHTVPVCVSVSYCVCVCMHIRYIRAYACIRRFLCTCSKKAVLISALCMCTKTLFLTEYYVRMHKYIHTYVQCMRLPPFVCEFLLITVQLNVLSFQLSASNLCTPWEIPHCTFLPEKVPAFPWFFPFSLSYIPSG